jgi:hypothetical protein
MKKVPSPALGSPNTLCRKDRSILQFPTESGGNAVANMEALAVYFFASAFLDSP